MSITLRDFIDYLESIEDKHGNMNLTVNSENVEDFEDIVEVDEYEEKVNIIM